MCRSVLGPPLGPGSVEPRSTSSGLNTTSRGSGCSPRVRATLRSTASRASSVGSWRSVVRPTPGSRASELSSQPATDTSSGTRIPRASRASTSPAATSSLNPTTAVGSSGSSSRARAARSPVSRLSPRHGRRRRRRPGRARAPPRETPAAGTRRSDPGRRRRARSAGGRAPSGARSTRASPACPRCGRRPPPGR